MTVDSNLPSSMIEENFAQALKRLEAGEPLEEVIAAYPATQHAELRELLTVVAATHHLQEAEVPRPTASRRTANKRAFLQAAAAMRAEVAAEAKAPNITQAATPPVAATPPSTAKAPAAPPTRAKPAVTAPGWAERVRAAWGNLFGGGFTFSPMQLAPIAIVLVAIAVSTFGFVSVAQAALPGDLAYPAKQWLRQTQISLAAEEDRPELVKAIEDEAARDLAKAKERAEQPIQATVTLFFRGWEDGNLLVGSLVIKPLYQVNPPDPATQQMSIPTTPVEGMQVTVVYQVVPDQAETDKWGRQIVQGISLTLDEESIYVPTITPEPCQVVTPAGWIPLEVPSGSTLGAIAASNGSTAERLAEVNCLPDPDQIMSGRMLLVPANPTPSPTLTPVPSLAATLTAVSPTVTSEVITATATVQPEATATLSTTVGVTPTIAVSATVTVTPTATLTATATTETTPTVAPTIIVTETATPASTPQPNPALTLTLTAIAETPTATVADMVTPVATPTPTATPVATGEPATGDSSNTATATAEATVSSAEGGAEGTPSAAATQTSERSGRSNGATAIATPTPTSVSDSPVKSGGG